MTVRDLSVIATLAVAMAAAGALLLLLETPTRGWPAANPFAREYRGAVCAVTIEAVEQAGQSDPTAYDCAILPDGSCLWQPRGDELRLAVIGSMAEGMGASQARSLLYVLGRLNRTWGLDRGRIALHRAGGPELADAPPLLRDLHALLVKKGVIH